MQKVLRLTGKGRAATGGRDQQVGQLAGAMCAFFGLLNQALSRESKPSIGAGACSTISSENIREHIEAETQDNIGRGMSPEEARYAALRKFGNVTRMKKTREVWSFIWLEQLLQDIRRGFRALRKSRASRPSPSSPSLSASAPTPRSSV